ncbi:Uncharacterized protein TCAP_01804 [Tolypocladium capitatum]|uniref:Uncharacterized protein n=1 Tax=Tolypocladium capitatum TaxID=45235 RepID=A0A2K3QL68_9HYPO|nr:Uncharacterized protein TCAP_01804 [Tolypocladium capitatum]
MAVAPGCDSCQVANAVSHSLLRARIPHSSIPQMQEYRTTIPVHALVLRAAHRDAPARVGYLHVGNRPLASRFLLRLLRLLRHPAQAESAQALTRTHAHEHAITETMQFALLLASLPGLALAAATAYTPPPLLLAVANDPSNSCVLPRDYHIRNFVAQSNDTGRTLCAYDFAYLDTATNSSTTCRYDAATSKSTTPDGMTQRFECRDPNVKFIWVGEMHKLVMIQRVCPGTTGIPAYEVSGSVVIPLFCLDKGSCVSNQTDHQALFTSIQPIRDATLARHRRAANVVRHDVKRGVAWSYGV